MQMLIEQIDVQRVLKRHVIREEKQNVIFPLERGFKHRSLQHFTRASSVNHDLAQR